MDAPAEPATIVFPRGPRGTADRHRQLERFGFKYKTLMKPDKDPRGAFDLLLWRVNMVVVALVALSLLAWISTIEQANSMASM